jgi:hypothetical protein
MNRNFASSAKQTLFIGGTREIERYRIVAARSMATSRVFYGATIGP